MKSSLDIVTGSDDEKYQPIVVKYNLPTIKEFVDRLGISPATQIALIEKGLCDKAFKVHLDTLDQGMKAITDAAYGSVSTADFAEELEEMGFPNAPKFDDFADLLGKFFQNKGPETEKALQEKGLTLDDMTKLIKHFMLDKNDAQIQRVFALSSVILPKLPEYITKSPAYDALTKNFYEVVKNSYEVGSFEINIQFLTNGRQVEILISDNQPGKGFLESKFKAHFKDKAKIDFAETLNDKMGSTKVKGASLGGAAKGLKNIYQALTDNDGRLELESGPMVAAGIRLISPMTMKEKKLFRDERSEIDSSLVINSFDKSKISFSVIPRKYSSLASEDDERSIFDVTPIMVSPTSGTAPSTTPGITPSIESTIAVSAMSNNSVSVSPDSPSLSVSTTPDSNTSSFLLSPSPSSNRYSLFGASARSGGSVSPAPTIKEDESSDLKVPGLIRSTSDSKK